MEPETRRSFNYAVVQIGLVWKVVCARKAMGNFASQDSALTAAHALAREATGEGHGAMVLIQSETGELTQVFVG
ncbi:MAG: hypothetical protein V4466_15440 [Pseudomonadota bacterium]